MPLYGTAFPPVLNTFYDFVSLQLEIKSSQHWKYVWLLIFQRRSCQIRAFFEQAVSECTSKHTIRSTIYCITCLFRIRCNTQSNILLSNISFITQRGIFNLEMRWRSWCLISWFNAVLLNITNLLRKCDLSFKCYIFYWFTNLEEALEASMFMHQLIYNFTSNIEGNLYMER